MNCVDDWAGYYQAALPNSSQFYLVSGRSFCLILASRAFPLTGKVDGSIRDFSPRVTALPYLNSHS